MNRRTVTIVGSAFGIVAAAGVVVIGQRLASERQRERENYRLELVRLRQEAARTPEKSAAANSAAAAGTESRTVCAGGADTLTLAAYHAAPTPVLKDGRLDVAKFAAVSDQSIRAERFVEESHEPPALPHRMGPSAAAPACFPITVSSKPSAKSPAPAKSNRARGR